MIVTDKTCFIAFLEEHDQQRWNRVLEGLLASIHAVDRMATRIWFGFWPIELTGALQEPAGSEEMARIMDLEGKWHLGEQIDSCIEFLYGANYWRQVKKAILSHAEAVESNQPNNGPLDRQIREVAAKVAAEVGADASLTIGITAVGFMILQQVGLEAMAAVADRPASGEPHRRSPDQLVRQREKESRDGLFTSLKGARRRYVVVWDEKTKGASFRAFLGEDIATAAAKEEWKYRAMDYRRSEGPIPVECRIASCGYCWVGILSGKDNLSELSDHERKRLHYFGYDQVNDPSDPRPPIRLACQAQCGGDVTLAIAPWNGELKRRFDKARDKLGIV